MHCAKRLENLSQNYAIKNCAETGRPIGVRPVEIGGDAGVQVTTDFSMPLIGDPTRTDAATGMRSSAKSKAEA